MALLAFVACFVPAQDFAAVSTVDRIGALEAGDAPESSPQLIDADSDSDDDQDDVVVAATGGRAHVPTARTSAMSAVVCIGVEHRSGLERPPRA